MMAMVDTLVYFAWLLGTACSFWFGIVCGIILTVALTVTYPLFTSPPSPSLQAIGFLLITKKFTGDTTVIEEIKKKLRVSRHERNLDVPHPKLINKGSFASYVWIAAASEWDVGRPIDKFPPPDIGTGSSKGLIKYYAEVKDGILSFSCFDSMQIKQVMKVELEGCKTRLVRESIGSKSIWWRKSPIEISHPSRCLYQGCSTIFMFCMNGSDKEQWVLALNRCLDKGDEIKVLEHLYKRYSKKYKQKTSIHHSGRHQVWKRTRQPEYKNGDRDRNGWLGNWRKGGSGKSVTLEPNKPPELAEEIDQLWSGEKSHSALIDERNKRNLWQQGRRLRVPRTNPQPAGSPTSSHKRLSSFDHPTPTQPSPLEPPSRSHPTEPGLLQLACSGENADGRPLNESESVSVESPGEGSVKESPIADGVFALNSILARLSFDLCRNRVFEDKFHAFILKKLRGLKTPDYLTPLTVCALDIGSNFPEVRNVRSLPPEGTIVVPEMLLDISYAGGLEVTVETFVNLKEAAAWGTLDRALTTLHGCPGTSKTPEDSVDILKDISDVADENMSITADQDLRETFGSPPDRPANGFSVRKFAAIKAKQLAEKMAASISNIPLRLSVKVERLEGTMLLWISPPPSNRLWMSFLKSPTLEVTAKPILANRVMKYSAILARVSSWLQRKIKQSFFSSLEFPNCADLAVPGLLGLDDSDGLRHPALAVMNELKYVSECESDREEEPQLPVSSAQNPDPAFKTSSTLETEIEEPSGSKMKMKFPEDERLNTIRLSRYDTQRLNFLRKSWQGEVLTQEEAPSRKINGKTVFKRCTSLSDGDAPEFTEVLDDGDGTMSDCNEFFDAEDFSSTLSPRDEAADQTPNASERDLQVRTFPIKASGPAFYEDDMPEGSRMSPGRGIGMRIGELLGRNFQNMLPEDPEFDRRRTGSNKILQAARSRVSSGTQRVRDAVGSRTSQIMNSGLTRRWPRRSSENRNNV